MIEDAIVQNLIEPNSKEEFLSLFYYPKGTPNIVVELFKFMEEHIELVPSGMGTVSLRETHSGLKKLLPSQFDWETVKQFIFIYEDKLLDDFYSNQKNN